MGELIVANLRERALAFRDFVVAGLAEIDSPDQAKEMLDKARIIRAFLDQVKASEDVLREVSITTLRIKAKLGQLLPREKGGRGKVSDQIADFHHKTIAAYRKLADHAELLEQYFDEVDGVPTQAGVLQYIRQATRVEVSPDEDAARSASGVRGDATWSFAVGDCRDLPFEDDQFDLVFCSPPYESQRSYSEVEFALAGDEYIQWAADCFMECLRVCKGLVAWVIEGVTENYAYSYSPFLLGAEILRRGGKLRKPVVYQRNGIPGTGGPDWLRNDWEPVICATKRGRLPWSDNTAMGSAPKQNTPRQATNRNKDGSRKSCTYVDPEVCNPGNVIKGLVGSGGLGWADAHQNEAPFPEWLAEFFVRSFCPPGGSVLDPFSGSGTTVSVAVRNGRNGQGIDARESQVWLGETRLMGLTVSERKGGQKTLV